MNIDFARERDRTERDLAAAEEQRRQASLAELRGEGTREATAAARAAAGELRERLADLDAAEAQQTADERRQLETEDAARCAEEAAQMDALIDEALGVAAEIDQMAPTLIAQVRRLREIVNAVFSLGANRLREGSRPQEKIELFSTALGGRAVDDWLDALSHKAGLTQRTHPANTIVDTPLAELVGHRSARASNIARAQMPALRERDA